MDERISVIVPVYRVEKYLPQCIDSLLAQTHRELEILLVDDGSPDQCGKICDEYAKRDARIRVIHQQNRGVSAARNAGLEQATGAYIGFVDGDDWAEPDMFERLYAWIKQERTQIVSCGWLLFEENTGRERADRSYEPMRLEYQEALYFMLRGIYFEGYVWNKLFDACLFRDNKMRFNESVHLCQDLLFVCHCLHTGASLYYNSEPLYHYRIHAQSAVRSFNVKRCAELLARREIVALTEGMESKLNELSKGLFSAAAVSLRAHATLSNNRQWMDILEPDAKLYAGLYLSSGEFSFRDKLRFLLLMYLPVPSMLIWGKVKKHFRLAWIRPKKGREEQRA